MNRSNAAWLRLLVATFSAAMLVGAFAPGTGLASSSAITPLKTLTVGSQPHDVAVDSTIGRVFVTNSTGNTVSIIDEASLAVVSTVAVGSNPQAVAVNSTTHRVYVANVNDGSLSILDGQSGSVLGTATGVAPQYMLTDVAVNPSTNRIYVGSISGFVAVMDGGSNPPATIGSMPVTEAYGLAVNPTTNRVYATSICCSAGLTVIDAATNTVVPSSIVLGNNPAGVAVNARTNRVYIAMLGDNVISVVNAADDSLLAPIALPTPPQQPIAVTVDETANRIYVANQVGDSLFAIDGDNAKLFTVPAAGTGLFHFGVGVDPTRAYVYLTNTMTGTMSVLADTPPVHAFESFAATSFRSHNRVSLAGKFVLQATSDGIDPGGETIAVRVGTFSTSLPAGALKSDGKGLYTFTGKSSGANLVLAIARLSPTTFVVGLELVNASTGPDPLTVGLTIGNDAGTTTAVPAPI